MLFVHESVIAAPVARVFAFHERPDALPLLTPPWERVEIIQPPTSLRPGTRVVLRVHVGPFSQRLESEHTLYEKDVVFQDRQLRGPFARFVHTHRFFEASGGHTLLRDEIDYALPLGPLGAALGGRMVRRRLERMFAFRHEATRAGCTEAARR